MDRAQPIDEVQRIKATMFVVGFGILFIAGLWAQVERFNGLSYWAWPWRNLNLGRALLFMSAPFIPFLWALRQIDGTLTKKKTATLVVAFVLINFSLQIAGIAVDPRSLRLVKDIVASTSSTNFYSAALEISSIRNWLASFHKIHFGVHSGTHPPGPILYYYGLISLFGPDLGATIGGYLVGVVASLGVAVMYSFSALWTPDVRSRLLACGLYAMLPALIFFFPSCDQVYPICSMLMIVFWVRALAEGGWWRAVLLGVALFVSTMLAYGLLTVGAFLVLYAIFLVIKHPKDRVPLRTILCGFIALGVFLALHLLLWWTTEYQALGSFRSAKIHAAMIYSSYFANYANPLKWYSRIVLFGPYDFFVGAGVLAFPLLLLYLMDAIKSFSRNRTDVIFSLLGLAYILLVDLTGLLPAETLRVWLFMEPFVVVPVALELRKFAPSNRLIIFTVQWIILVVMKCKLAFLVP